MQKFKALYISLITSFVLSCNTPQKKITIIGTWEIVNENQISLLQFYEDGTMDNGIGFHLVKKKTSPSSPYIYSTNTNFMRSTYKGTFSQYTIKNDTLCILNLVTNQWDTLLYTIQSDTLTLRLQNQETYQYKYIENKEEQDSILAIENITLFKPEYSIVNNEYDVSINKKGQVLTYKSQLNNDTSVYFYWTAQLNKKEIQRFNRLLKRIDLDKITKEENCKKIADNEYICKEVARSMPLEISFIDNKKVVNIESKANKSLTTLATSILYSIQLSPDSNYFDQNNLVKSFTNISYITPSFFFGFYDKNFSTKEARDAAYKIAKDKAVKEAIEIDAGLKYYDKSGNFDRINEASEIKALLAILYYAPVINSNISFDEKFYFASDSDSIDKIYTDGRYFKYKNEIKDIGFNFFDLKRTKTNIFQKYRDEVRLLNSCFFEID